MTTRIHPIDFVTTVGPQYERIAAGEVLCFQLDLPADADGHQRASVFFTSPTGPDDYYPRTICLSDVAGDFSNKLGRGAIVHGDGGIYFYVKGRPAPKYKGMTQDTTTPDLKPGSRYFINVKQDDPTIACRIDWALNAAK